MKINKDVLPPFSFVQTIRKCFSHMTKVLQCNDLQ